MSAPPLAVLAPMWIEGRAVRAGAPWARVHHIGVGPRRAGRRARLAAAVEDAPLLVAGFCGALNDHLSPGDVVLPDQLLGPAGATTCPDPTILAAALRRNGLPVHIGAIASSARIAAWGRRRELGAGAAIAADMESAAVLQAVADRPVFIIRVVLDTGHHELHHPVRTAGATVSAYRALRRASAGLEEWASALGRRDVLLATPRASCAGVERAVQVVELALEECGPPVYVRKQIVHNGHVIAELERRGAVFVEEIDEVPPGATVIFSAHGVSPEVRLRANERKLAVIDATCPLVSKVHAEARQFRARGFQIVLVGHEGHEEVEGTFGEAPERTHVVSTTEDVRELEIDDPERVAYLTQTTLAIDDTAEVVEALRERAPGLAGPRSSDICYATQNRQDAVRALAPDCQLVLVIGSGNSSNSRRLVEVARRAGCRAMLIEDGGQIPLEALAGVTRVGVTAGASAPESLVSDVVRALAGLGGAELSERRVATEDVQFKLPVELRRKNVSNGGSA